MRQSKDRTFGTQDFKPPLPTRINRVTGLGQTSASCEPVGIRARTRFSDSQPNCRIAGFDAIFGICSCITLQVCNCLAAGKAAAQISLVLNFKLWHMRGCRAYPSPGHESHHKPLPTPAPSQPAPRCLR